MSVSNSVQTQIIAMGLPLFVVSRIGPGYYNIATKLKVEEGRPDKLQNFSSSGARFQDVSCLWILAVDLLEIADFICDTIIYHEHSFNNFREVVITKNNITFNLINEELVFDTIIEKFRTSILSILIFVN